MSDEPKQPAEEVADEALDDAQGGVQIDHSHRTAGPVLSAGVNINNDHRVVQSTTLNTADHGTSLDADVVAGVDVAGVNINNQH